MVTGPSLDQGTILRSGYSRQPPTPHAGHRESRGKPNGKSPGIMSTGVDEASAQIERGFRCVAYWCDIWLYADALREGIAKVRDE